MKWISTRKKVTTRFQDALFCSLGLDGGLYMPEFLPQITKKELQTLSHTSFQDIAFHVLTAFLKNDIPTHALKHIVSAALNFPLPIKKIGPFYVLELFHGPTMAFKDVAAQLLAHLMEYFLLKEKKDITLLVATSGDTGGAVAQAFANRKHIKVFVLFPKGKVSTLQEEQLTYVADNIFPLEIEGTFDECQSIVKKAFLDRSLHYLNISTANSINVGRLLPQISYYLYVASRLGDRALRIVVPSGNMGNITAGIMAKKMGAPINEFLVACNKNDVVATYTHTGVFRPKESIPTLSNAMDIGSPSNFERLHALYDHNHEAFCQDIKARSVSDAETIATIQHVYHDFGYILDPHTAVAWKAAEIEPSDYETCIISTAAPQKFAGEIRVHAGIDVPITHPNSKSRSKRVFKTSSNYALCIKDIDTLAKG